MKKTIIALLSAVMFTGVCSAFDMMDKQASKELNTALTQEKNKSEAKATSAASDKETYNIIEENYPEFIDTDVFDVLKNILKQNINFRIKTISYVNRGKDYMPTISEIKINDKSYSIKQNDESKVMKRIDLWSDPKFLNDFRKAYKNHPKVEEEIKFHLLYKLYSQYYTARSQQFSKNEKSILLKDYKIPFKCQHTIEFFFVNSNNNYLKCTPFYHYKNGSIISDKKTFIKYDTSDSIVFVDDLLFNSDSAKNLNTEVSFSEKFKYAINDASILYNGPVVHKSYNCEKTIYRKEEDGKFKRLSPEIKDFKIDPKLDCSRID